MAEIPGNRVKVALINNYSVGKGKERISRLTKILSTFPITLEIFSYQEIPVRRLMDGNFDCLILSGSGMNISDPDDRRKMGVEIRLIRDVEIPILGICFGLQLAAHAFGATIRRNEKSGEWGTDIGKEIDISIMNDPEKIIGLSSVPVNVRHRDYVRPNDPEFLKSFEVRAISVDGALEYVQYAKHRERPLFCVQFHPECFDKTDDAVKMEGERIVHNFLRWAWGERNAAVK